MRRPCTPGPFSPWPPRLRAVAWLIGAWLLLSLPVWAWDWSCNGGRWFQRPAQGRAKFAPP